MGFFSPSRPCIEAGTKVMVYTVNNWKGDGTGGAPGEVMEVASLDVHIMWETEDGSASVDAFHPRTRRSTGTSLQAGFQLRDEPFSPAPELPVDYRWNDEK
jgi:hypothetical protein